MLFQLTQEGFPIFRQVPAPSGLKIVAPCNGPKTFDDWLDAGSAQSTKWLSD
jgi:hypothetical protein